MKRTLIAVVSVAALATGVTGAVAFADQPDEPPTTPVAAPTADELRAAVDGCDTQLSDGEYSEDEDGSAEIPVCQTGDAVHWKADLDVDCDGQRTDQCNEETDPWFQPETSYEQSDGQPLNSAELPFIVVPLASDLWDFSDAGIDGGTVVVVTYEDKVVYAVVGDQGPKPIIGEGSYALAEALGIDPDPATGGVEGKVVDYILFPGVTADPIEDHDAAAELGEQAASELIAG